MTKDSEQKTLLGDVASVDFVHKVVLPMDQLAIIGVTGLALSLIGFGVKEAIKAAFKK